MADDKPWKKRRDEDDDDDRDDRPKYRRYEDDGDDDFDDYDDRPRGRGGRMSRELLRGIANNQRGIIICIAIYLSLIPIQFLIPEPIRIGLAAVAVPLIITAAVFVFMLSLKVYGTAAGIILGILTLIPLIGLLPLLIINGKATAVLKKHGIHVGFFGANSSDI